MLTLESDCQALTLLTSLISSGNTSIPLVPASVPPPHHLAFAATLAIHPTLTIRASSNNRAEEASLALWYLRLLLKVVGPIHANFHSAFIYTAVGIRGVSGRRRVLGDSGSNDGDDRDSISSELAETGAIWARAEDFWQVAGWGFNCSVLHKRRWARWHQWLDFMIEVFERDWEARGSDVKEDATPSDGKPDPREGSMIVGSLISGGSSGKERRILRAIFADGKLRAAGEFTEIWKNETKERKQVIDLKRISKKIDIATDDYGDYMDEDRDSELEDSDTNSQENLPSLNPPSSTTTLPNLSDPLGGSSSLNLRYRLLSLLSAVSIALPHKFTPLPNLFDLICENIRPLPLPTFFALMSPIQLAHFPPRTAIALTKFLLNSLIAASAPMPTDEYPFSQETLELCYIPYTANTSSIADNAKVSLLIEALLRIVDRHKGLSWTPRLQDAVDEGIPAREKKAKTAARKRDRNSASGGDERLWLTASAARIRSVVAMARPR